MYIFVSSAYILMCFVVAYLLQGLSSYHWTEMSAERVTLCMLLHHQQPLGSLACSSAWAC